MRPNCERPVKVLTKVTLEITGQDEIAVLQIKD